MRKLFGIRLSAHKVSPMKKFVVALAAVFLGSVTGYAQTPTLSLARGNSGISSNESGRASNFEFYMEASGWPRAVTAGETIFMMGSWPNGNNPTMSDDKSNTWASAVSCNDSGNVNHGFYYAINAAANTSVLTETHSTAVDNGVFDWAHFYYMSTTSSGFVDGSSCKTGVTPANNTAPNITGTAYTTGTSGDLILTCVYVEGPLGQISGSVNAFTSITWPTGFTGLSDETFYGHACAYRVQTTAGSFTPTFTVAQGTHSSFTIISAAFKAGSGGSAPGNGASIVLGEMHYTTGSGQTDTLNLPCPAGTTNVTIMDDANSLTGVTDSSSNTWHSVVSSGTIFYVNSPSIPNGNTYIVNMTFGTTGNYDLVGLFCLGNTNGVDTAATAKNSSTLLSAGSGTTYHSPCSQSSTVATDCPSIGTSASGDLVLAVGAIGQGPADSCVTGQCVFDYIGSTNWTNGDNQSYSNGDTMAHQYAPTASTVEFEYNLAPGVTAGSAMATAFQATSSQGPPAPPTNLQATVH
jgi:hypothetical protein